MATVSHVPATLEHARALAPVMRLEERNVARELGLTTLELLEDCLDAARVKVATFFDGELAALWGVGDDGMLWVAVGPPVSRLRQTFFREAQRAMRQLLAFCPAAWAVVDPRHDAALVLAAHLGLSAAGDGRWRPVS